MSVTAPISIGNNSTNSARQNSTANSLPKADPIMGGSSAVISDSLLIGLIVGGVCALLVLTILFLLLIFWFISLIVAYCDMHWFRKINKLCFFQFWFWSWLGMFLEASKSITIIVIIVVFFCNSSINYYYYYSLCA